ncbi:glycosyl hydrolase family 16 [Flavobacteriaceae bacterium MAR_2010_105]|nr:glycosyl hydrolase family 16 [Flavobacteriaceae bacterium MAR_2010_105]
MKKLFYVVILIILCFVSCSSGDDSNGQPQPIENIIPTNLVLNITIVGSNSNNPNGDGTGVIQCSASATNAVKYGFKFDNAPEQESLNGAINHTYTNTGTNSYVVTVFAYSSTGHSISTFKNITVYVATTGPQLIWSDEFNIDGAPSSANWTYDLGAGGWGNNEAQTYTNSSNNVIVENGLLKIKAKSDGSGGYTSARLKTQGLFDFTYGRVEVRAKLPASAGTWPAIWMLGSNFGTVGWPRCGEIDIMEQTGDNKNKVLGTCHWFNTSNSSTASYGLDTTVSTSTSAFHIYSMEWDASTIKISVDGNQYYVIDISSSAIPNSPFHDKFFMILNVAMGGTLGGTIPGNFTESVMEIDYVRVYQ